MTETIKDGGQSTAAASSEVPLWLAVHECGHAVVGLILNELPPYSNPFLEFVTVRAVEETLGECRKQARVNVEILPRYGLQERVERYAIQDASHEIVELLAGPLAEFRQRFGVLGPAQSKKRMFEILLGPEVVDRNEDAANIQRYLAWIAPPDPERELSKLWDQATRIIEAEWLGIIFMARKLKQMGEIEGQEFEETWRSVRAGAHARDLGVKGVEVSGLPGTRPL